MQNEYRAIAKTAHAIIPARYASTRFPGKPLVMLHGKPMFWHVWSKASQCPAITSVTLATDDARIAEAATQFGVPWVMTAGNHVSGTDRTFEAATLLGIANESLIINIQGDEPALAPKCLTALIHAFTDPSVHVATLARQITAKQACSTDTVKVVCAANGNALYFSRSPIPYDRSTATASCHSLGHMGLYAFTMTALKKFVHLPPSFLEQTECLEQLRLIENGISIRVVVTEHASPGVDRPEDIAAILALLTPQ